MNAPGYVSSDYLRLAARRGQFFKNRTHELLAVQPGERVLDVGCGPGLDTCELALRIGEGRVYGVDVDADMIAQADAEAQLRHLAARVEHMLGDVRSLPFEDGFFDAVRAERLLQVLPPSHDPVAVVAELGRVVRPGGRLLLADADWASASVDCEEVELERRLLAFFAARMRPNGYAGRQLLALMQSAGFEVEPEAVPMIHRDLALLPFGQGLVDKALAAGVITPAEGESWLLQIEKRLQSGSFFASLNMIIAVGRKPGPKESSHAQ